MVIIENYCELNQNNLAVIGVMDDFYQLYCEIKDIYETKRKEFVKENQLRTPLWSKVWDEMCLKEVRKACEPILNKCLYIFSDEYQRFFSNAYAFQNFSFINSAKINCYNISNSSSILSYKSFSEFLIDIQIIMACTNHRWKNNIDSNYSFSQSWIEINQNIKKIAQTKRIECEAIEEMQEPITNTVLYLFNKLSSTSCYKFEQPVVPARFIATTVTTGRNISLPVHYCNYCKKYFIGIKTLAVFEKTFGKLIIDKKSISEMEYDFGCFSLESKLHKLGYNVINGRLSEEERKNLLIYLIENQMISYLDLCSTIEQNIKLFQNSYRHRLAVEKWKIDLKAIGEYVLSKSEEKV